MLSDPALISDAHRETRLRVLELLDGADRAIGETTVPACPAWTVRMVISHLAGADEDILAGRLEGVASDAWTGAQVERHLDDDLGSLLAIWAELGPQIDGLLPVIPAIAASQLVFDVFAHEQDVRGALDQPGGRESTAVTVALGFLLSSLRDGIEAKGLPSLLIAFTDREPVVLGESEARISLEASGWELLRALGGRRSVGQIRAMAWSADPEPYLALYGEGPVRPPSTDLVE